MDKFQDALGDQDGAVIFPQIGPLNHHVGNKTHYVVDGEFLFLDLLPDEDDVGVGLKSYLQGDVGGAAAHQPGEMPIFQI